MYKGLTVKRSLAVLLVAALLTGCGSSAAGNVDSDNERIAELEQQIEELEQQNKELKQELKDMEDASHESEGDSDDSVISSMANSLGSNPITHINNGITTLDLTTMTLMDFIRFLQEMNLTVEIIFDRMDDKMEAYATHSSIKLNDNFTVMVYNPYGEENILANSRVYSLEINRNYMEDTDASITMGGVPISEAPNEFWEKIENISTTPNESDNDHYDYITTLENGQKIKATYRDVVTETAAAGTSPQMGPSPLYINITPYYE